MYLIASVLFYRTFGYQPRSLTTRLHNSTSDNIYKVKEQDLHLYKTFFSVRPILITELYSHFSTMRSDLCSIETPRINVNIWHFVLKIDYDYKLFKILHCNL